jgi:hypothetical protein
MLLKWWELVLVWPQFRRGGAVVGVGLVVVVGFCGSDLGCWVVPTFGGRSYWDDWCEVCLTVGTIVGC